MRTVTSGEFRRAVKIDPAWASKLTEPIEVTDWCDMHETKITHLSTLLHFTGKNEDGNSAFFTDCKSLKIAEGKFEGFVSFLNSGIEKIGDLSCGKNEYGVSASFWKCSSLIVAEGRFKGNVSFSNSRIEKIGDLSCGKNNRGIRLSVEDCPNLKSIPISFDPKEVRAHPKLIEKLEVDRFIQKRRTEGVEIEL